MKKFDQWWMPDGETHLPEWMQNVNNRVDGRLTYQYGKYEAALPFLKNNRMAVDVGAHIGLWSYFLSRDFEKVLAFEPMRDHQSCWYKNMEGRDNAILMPLALGVQEGRVTLETRTPGSSGDTQVKPYAAGEIEMRTLDSFERDDVDLIKIDCEGFEEFIVRGAVDTLLKCRPCVIVEQKGNMAGRYGLEQQGAVKFLKTLGARVRHITSGDYILSWD